MGAPEDSVATQVRIHSFRRADRRDVFGNIDCSRVLTHHALFFHLQNCTLSRSIFWVIFQVRKVFLMLFASVIFDYGGLS